MVQPAHPVLSNLLRTQKVEELVLGQETAVTDCPAEHGHRHFLYAVAAVNSLRSDR